MRISGTTCDYCTEPALLAVRGWTQPRLIAWLQGKSRIRRSCERHRDELLADVRAEFE